MLPLKPYQYQPLESGEIRVMELLPLRDLPNAIGPRLATTSSDSTGNFHDPIRINIYKVRFQQDPWPNELCVKPPYEALSYVWGTPSALRSRLKVLCGDSFIEVTPNLRVALSYLRLHGNSRYLWVDAICINQIDVQERNHQVGLMRKIYSCAKRVMIWLGSGKRIEDAICRLGGHQPNHIFADLAAPFTTIGQFGLEMSVERLINLPWFERVWVIQEAVFAKEAMILGGRQSLEWTTLIEATFKFRETCQLDELRIMRCDALLGIEHLRYLVKGENPPYSKLDQGLRRVLASFDYDTYGLEPSGKVVQSGVELDLPWHRTHRLRRPPRDFLELVELFRQHSATDGRDKIYALHGLASALEHDRLSKVVQIDYSLCEEEVFTRFTRAVITQSGSLRVFHNVEWHGMTISKLPSWVPNWTHAAKSPSLTKLHQSKYFLQNETPHLGHTRHSRILSIFGQTIDEVKVTGECLSPDALDDANLQIWNSWILLAQAHGVRRPELFRTWYFNVARDDGQNYQSRLDWPRRFIPDHLETICSGRRFLVTEQRRAGLCPPGAQCGDLVVLFAGAQLPFVVRRVCEFNELRHFLVGECYLDGVSLNLLWRGKDSPKYQEFHLE